MKITLLFFSFVLGLGGCVTSVTSIPPDYSLGAKEEAIVIGRVSIELWVKPLEFFDRLNSIALVVRNVTTGKDYTIHCDQRGSESDFYVALPYGRYSLLRVEKGNMQITGSASHLFEVRKDQIAYLGTLKFVYRGQGAGDIIRDAIWGLGSMPLQSLTIDETDKTLKSFREKYPQVSQPIEKRLMIGGAAP